MGAWCWAPWDVRVLGTLLLDLSPDPQVCLLHENAQGSALDICAQPIQVFKTFT